MKKSQETIGFERKVYKILENEGIEFKSNAYVSGSPVDFFVEPPQGGTIVLQAKNWNSSFESPSYLNALNESYRKASGADYSFIVVPDNYPHSEMSGVVKISEIGTAIKGLPSKRKKRKLQVDQEKLRIKAFAAMPFSEKYYDTFEVAFVKACYEFKVECIRIDHKEFTGDIVAEIKKEIKASKFVIADLSESRPNVLFEIGYGAACGKKIIQVCSTDLKEIPFDVRNDNTIKYTIGATSMLRRQLIDSISNIINEK